MNLKIIQPAGLGDILFCLKIAVEYSKNFSIFWPVVPQYSWIKDYLIYDNIKWEDIPNPDKILNIQEAAKIYPSTPIMDAKYKIADLSYDNWQSYIKFKRYPHKEENLYKFLIKEKPYCLINEIFATPPSLNRHIEKSSIFNVYVDYYNNFTPFDWCKIIEEASELRLVDTCYSYIIEKLNLSSNKIYLYARQEGIFHTKHLWTKPWRYIE